MTKPKLQLTKLKPVETNEISIVPHGANLVPRYDIVKDVEAIESITKEDFEDTYENVLSNEMWSAFKYALSRGIGEITCDWNGQNTKEEKIQYLSELFTKFLNDIQSNDMLKELHEECNTIQKSITEEKNTPVNDIEKDANKQEKSMEKDTLIQKAMSYIESLFKGEEVVVTEPIEKDEKAEEVEAVVKSAEQPSLEAIQKELDDAKVEIKKEREALEAEKLEIQKQKEAVEAEAIEKEKEIVEKQEKSELLSICKEKLSFAEGTPDENVEKLFKLKKSVDAESFEWIVKSLEKKSENIEKMMDESGVDTPIDDELTPAVKLDRIAKSIEENEKVDAGESYKLACERNKDLRDLALGLKRGE